MSIVITEPIKTINGLLTEAIAAESQLLYKVQRQDFTFSSFGSRNGEILLLLNPQFEDNSSFFTIGDTVAVSQIDAGVIQNPAGNYIVSYVDYTSPDTRLQLQNTVGGGLEFDEGYVNNNTTLVNYRIKVVPKNEDGTDLYEDEVDLRYVPSQAGTLNFDIGDIYANFMKTAPSFSKMYLLRITEEWEGSAEPHTDTTVLQAILASKQLLDVGGANMWENLLRLGGGENVNWKYVASQEQPIPEQIGGDGGNWGFFGSGITARVILQPNDRSPTLTILQHDGFISVGSILSLAGSVSVQVSGFSAAGDVRAQLMGIRADKSLSELAQLTLESVVGDHGGIAYNTVFSSPITVEEFVGIGVRYQKVGGAFAADIIIDGAREQNLSVNYTSAELLTQFKNPVLRLGWNRTAATLVDENIVSREGIVGQLHFRLETYNINKQNLNSNTNLQFDPNIPTVVIRGISEALGIGEAQYLGVTIRENNVNLPLSEQLFYRVLPDCEGICIDWINQLGGVDQWVFTNFSSHTIEADAGIVAERPIISDIEFINRTKQRFAKSFRERVTLREIDLTYDQLLALQEIKLTESLRVYLTKDGSEFIDAIVIRDFSSDFDSNMTTHKFTLVIEFPDDFIFSRGKKY